MTNILINGSSGRMGGIAEKAIAQSSEFRLVGKTGRADNLAEAIQTLKPDIVIDLTSAESVYQNTLTILENGVRAVVGTSGLVNSDIESLKKICETKQLGCLIVPNFSLGALLMMHFSKEAAKYFAWAEILEAHHENKRDAPSGTAIATAQAISEVRKNAALPVETQETFPKARGAEVDSVPVHAIRLPGYIASQEVIFGSPGETLKISHNTINRDCYMPGILLACRQVMKLSSLRYGLSLN